ncbi:PAS domain S-box protein [Gemmata sp. JC717]|uniref:PAS domain S-box protein n=1 Tax=Gemmata algarum TaxID=2975278 RepID=UPI0021BA894D|nr:PAS domain S-box protein [Gemmata algarum]MDY3553519.1 PAS domain S-box protein [Gemmata algarum]
MADETDPTTAALPPDAAQDRLAQPVDAEQPPRLSFPVVGVGASAGGLEAFSEFLAAMPPDAGMAFVFIPHLPPNQNSLLADILARRTAMPVHEVEDGLAVEPDHVYVTRPGHVVGIREGRLRVGPELGGPRAANRPVDDFFRTLAEEQRERAICVLLSGMGSNGTAGAQAVKAVGGLCVAQDPDSAQYPSMPRHLIDAGYADYIVRPTDLPDVLLTYARSRYATGGREADARAVLQQEGHHLREILAVLRTRTKQDFAGYKKPTILRRVQRRMGLLRVPTMSEYARHLRQSPNEVTGLADDLLIHVTGFFRDPEAWEALRERVIAPLVAAREPGGPVRAWVAACSSGEEAYTLAMILLEESDRADKRLDIKVFATDLADRTLAHARAGVYPGGIESEISSERLKRFFVREDEVYRVRQELRDRVVFAPQNILQDPLFSRLDIATCRNLLIYLEADVQKRVLMLLHFGLREGGALFLGTSETIGGAEELFEPVDKKARIYRRVGPTRHGLVEFPLPYPVPPLAPAPDEGRGQARPSRPGDRSVGDLTRQALLEHHTPPAVAVDRDFQVVYYHGDTSPFLQQVSGEPTRDLLLLARDGVRGAARLALQYASAQQQPATVHDGWIERPGRQVRVAVNVSPVPTGAPANHFVVSFEERGEVPAPAAPNGEAGDLARLRAELQSTIEELQTSNEELKASHEEAMSVNEELQSANEELETSKEEMQSLNEELRTVNAQLRAKMEEHQAASSDLTSLLTSTDIAVLFLDTRFRIRRFTPAVRDLLDLIPGDIGRPLTALARKFDDPHLDDDCRAVLERLVPVAREVAAAAGRHYLRRVLPYRTVDDRIDGLVVTFVDVTERKRAEDALAAEKEYAESIVETLHEPLLILHPDLTVKGVNPAFYTHFRVNPADTIGRKVYQLGNGQWDIPALRTLLEDVLPDSNVFNDYEVTHEFEGLGRRVMLVSGRRLDHVQLILLGVRDITDRKRAEEALLASEEKYRTLFEAIDAGFAIFEMIYDAAGAAVDFRYVETNPAFGRQAGRRPRPGQTMRELFPEAEDMWLADYAEVARTGRPKRFVDQAPGLGRWFDVFVFPVAAGRLAALFRDVTAEKQAEDALRASERRYRALVESQVEMVAQFRTDGTLLFVNGAYARVFGTTPERLTGTSFWDLMPPEERAAVRARLDALTPDAPLVQIENMIAAADGPRWTLWTNRALAFDAAGRVAEAQSAGVDITDRKRAEAALHESEERLRLAVAIGELGTWDWDTRTGQVVWNETHFAMQGYAVGGVAPSYEAWVARVHPDDRAGAVAALEAARDARAVYRHEFRSAHPDGSVRWLSARGRFFHDEAGAAVRMLGVMRDVTEQRVTEDALRRSEERLRLALSAARMGTWTWDVAADAHRRDASLNALLGLPAADTVSPFAEFLAHIHPDDREAVRAAFDQSVRHGRPLNVEFRVVRPDGAVRWLRDRGDVFGTAGQPRMTGACVDVTERREAEDAVRASEERLRLILESATDFAIITLDAGRAVTTWNPGAEATFGFTAGEIVGRSGDLVFTPEDRAAGAPEQEATEARETGRAADERWHVRKDGSRFWAAGVLAPLGTGGANGFVKVLRDLTERKRAEDELRQARDDLEVRVKARTAELEAALDALETEMERRRDLVRRLGAAQENERQRVARDLHDTVGQLMAGLALAFKAVEQSGTLPAAAVARLADAQRVMNELGREVHGLAVRLRPTALDDFGLEAALAQLVTEWSGRTGVPGECHAAGLGRLPREIETAIYRITQEALTNVAKHAGAAAVGVVVTRPGEFVTVVVEDDGAGFDPAAGFKGRLGLLGMRERVELLSGTIDIESSPGAGTAVTVQIPVTQDGGES